MGAHLDDRLGHAAGTRPCRPTRPPRARRARRRGPRRRAGRRTGRRRGGRSRAGWRGPAAREPSMRTGSPCMFQPVATTCRWRRQSQRKPGIDRQPSGASSVSSPTGVDVGVDQVADLAVDVPGEHPQADADLRGGQAGAAGGEHGLGQVGDEAAQLRVEVDDRGGGGAQHGVAEQPDGGDAHPTIVGGTLIALPLPGRSSAAGRPTRRGRPCDDDQLRAGSDEVERVQLHADVLGDLLRAAHALHLGQRVRQRERPRRAAPAPGSARARPPGPGAAARAPGRAGRRPRAAAAPRGTPPARPATPDSAGDPGDRREAQLAAVGQLALGQPARVPAHQRLDDGVRRRRRRPRPARRPTPAAPARPRSASGAASPPPPAGRRGRAAPRSRAAARRRSRPRRPARPPAWRRRAPGPPGTVASTPDVLPDVRTVAPGKARRELLGRAGLPDDGGPQLGAVAVRAVEGGRRAGRTTGRPGSARRPGPGRGEMPSGPGAVRAPGRRPAAGAGQRRARSPGAAPAPAPGAPAASARRAASCASDGSRAERAAGSRASSKSSPSAWTRGAAAAATARSATSSCAQPDSTSSAASAVRAVPGDDGGAVVQPGALDEHVAGVRIGRVRRRRAGRRRRPRSTTRPRSRTGANIAARVPSTTWAAPREAARNCR